MYIAVRHDLHEQLYVDTIRAGKALLAEKPFGIDRAAADAVMAAIDEHPEAFARISSEMPFFPGAQWAIDYVRPGALGRVIDAKSRSGTPAISTSTAQLEASGEKYCGVPA